MMPHLAPVLTAMLPAVQVIGAWLICSRLSYQKHPALVAYLITESLWQPLAWLGVPIEPWARLIQIPIRTAMVFEVLRYSRIPARPRLVIPALAASVALAFAARGLTGTQTLYLARQYYHVLLCAALLWAVIWRWRAPVLECARHRVYRVGAAAWMTVLAASGSFVRGGIGYRIFPHTQAAWDVVNVLTYAALVVVVGAMAVAMTASAPRKAAAKVADDWQVRRGSASVRGRMAA